MARQYGSNRVIGDQPEFDEVVAKSTAMLALIIQRLTQVLRANKVLADENFAEFC